MKCRMCSPFDSTFLHGEQFHISSGPEYSMAAFATKNRLLIICWNGRTVMHLNNENECAFMSGVNNTQPFNGLFSRTTWVGRYQKDKLFWILLKQEMTGCQWHQLDHMQIICTSLQTDNQASTSSLHIFTGRMLFLQPNQQRQSTEGHAVCNSNID